MIFFTGSIAYFRTEINLWSKPENFLYLKAPPSSFESAQVAYDYLNTHAPDAKRWRVSLASPRMPFNTLEWQDQNHKYYKLQDPNTGLILTEGRESLGGDFFLNYITVCILCPMSSVERLWLLSGYYFSLH